jgi:hypothetical protein
MSKITNKAAKPSKVITRNAAEIAIIENANSVADADAGSLDQVAVFADIFGGMPNTADGVAEFKTRRDCWVTAYTARMGCSDKGAANRFAEMVRAAEVTKPQTAEAAKKAEQRAAAAPAKPDKSRDAGNGIAAPAKGAAIGTKVKAELSAMEAHIIDLYRRGKLADIITMLQSEIQTAARV